MKMPSKVGGCFSHCACTVSWQNKASDLLESLDACIKTLLLVQLCCVFNLYNSAVRNSTAITHASPSRHLNVFLFFCSVAKYRHVALSFLQTSIQVKLSIWLLVPPLQAYRTLRRQEVGCEYWHLQGVGLPVAWAPIRDIPGLDTLPNGHFLGAVHQSVWNKKISADWKGLKDKFVY